MKIGMNTRVSSRSLDVAVVAQHAEALGFDSLWLPEHVVLPVQVTTRPVDRLPPAMRDMGDPFIALARASAVTTTLKLGTGIC